MEIYVMRDVMFTIKSNRMYLEVQANVYDTYMSWNLLGMFGNMTLRIAAWEKAVDSKHICSSLLGGWGGGGGVGVGGWGGWWGVGGWWGWGGGGGGGVWGGGWGGGGVGVGGVGGWGGGGGGGWGGGGVGWGGGGGGVGGGGGAAPGSEPLPYFRESRTPKTYHILGKSHNPGHPMRSWHYKKVWLHLRILWVFLWFGVVDSVMWPI